MLILCLACLFYISIEKEHTTVRPCLFSYKYILFILLHAPCLSVEFNERKVRNITKIYQCSVSSCSRTRFLKVCVVLYVCARPLLLGLQCTHIAGLCIVCALHDHDDSSVEMLQNNYNIILPHHYTKYNTQAGKPGNNDELRQSRIR